MKARTTRGKSPNWICEDVQWRNNFCPEHNAHKTYINCGISKYRIYFLQHVSHFKMFIRTQFPEKGIFGPMLMFSPFTQASYFRTIQFKGSGRQPGVTLKPESDPYLRCRQILFVARKKYFF